ncbi:hypothetical protein GJAV_G00164510 [Gymnothorax javanicus]|nr:hypothetical protein GJAV_G00164510 [Gymnothorax javanicus]
MDPTTPLKLCCGIWRQDVSSRSFKSCKLRVPKLSQQNIVQSTTLPLPACLLPMMHPGTMSYLVTRLVPSIETRQIPEWPDCSSLCVRKCYVAVGIARTPDRETVNMKSTAVRVWEELEPIPA